MVAVPDMHLPFTDWKSVAKIYAAIEKLNPTHVVQLGDMFDMFSFSKFAKHPIGMTPEEELSEGYNGACRFWSNVHKAAPKAKKIQLSGNHEARLMRSCIERAPDLYSLLSRASGDFWRFKNVQTIHDHRHELELSGVIYCHGWLTQLGAHARYLLKPVVHGHSHRGGSVFMNLGGKTIWELDCGYLADKYQVPLQYGPTKTILWTLGYGVIDERGPRFIPF